MEEGAMDANAEGVLGTARNRSLVMCLILLGLALSGSGCLLDPMPGEGPIGDGGGRSPLEAEWSAWVNRMPPGPASLHVHGRVTMPHPGFEVRLARRTPQGFNPAILMMDLEVRELEGMWAQVLTEMEVSYVEDPYRTGGYRQVHIFYPGGNSVLIDLVEAF
jgi:hypothetical protein